MHASRWWAASPAWATAAQGAGLEGQALPRQQLLRRTWSTYSSQYFLPSWPCWRPPRSGPTVEKLHAALMPSADSSDMMAWCHQKSTAPGAGGRGQGAGGRGQPALESLAGRLASAQQAAPTCCVPSHEPRPGAALLAPLNQATHPRCRCRGPSRRCRPEAGGGAGRRRGAAGQARLAAPPATPARRPPAPEV
jgi:hypothetical protein